MNHKIGFLNSVMKKLENEKFVNNAPENVIQKEYKKRNDANMEISVLKERITSLQEMQK